MNLFEAKKLLQGVGYSVKKDQVEKAVSLLESIIAEMPSKHMISEMSRIRRQKAAGHPYADLIIDLESAMEYVNTVRSNFKAGKAKSTNLEKAGKYLATYEQIAEVADELDDFGKETLAKFENDNYVEALEAGDASLVKVVNDNHGAGEGGSFAQAVSRGDVKRALECIKNSIRSGKSKGWSDTARNNAIANIDTVKEMEGAEAFAADLEKVQAMLDGTTAGGAKPKATYTLVAGDKLKLVTNVLTRNNLQFTANDDGTVTFYGNQSKVNAALTAFEKLKIDVDENVVEKAPKNSASVKVVTVDDVEAAEAALDDDFGTLTYEVNDDTIQLTGTAAQIKKAINAMEALGVEVTEAAE